MLAIYINWRLFLLTQDPSFDCCGGRRIQQADPPYSRAVQDRVGYRWLAQETLSGIKVVKGFAMEEAEKERFQRGNEQSFKPP